MTSKKIRKRIERRRYKVNVAARYYPQLVLLNSTPSGRVEVYRLTSGGRVVDVFPDVSSKIEARAIRNAAHAATHRKQIKELIARRQSNAAIADYLRIPATSVALVRQLG